LATDRLTDRQTDEQMDSIVAQSRSRCRERQLNNAFSAVDWPTVDGSEKSRCLWKSRLYFSRCSNFKV